MMKSGEAVDVCSRKPKDYKYLFSFVMPVYNVGPYLAETIDSVLEQSLEFRKNAEIILINDGSTDNSEEICLRYQKLFPNNIKYVKQNNQGVSAARNRGIEEVEGKYISFLDADDRLSPNTLDEVFTFFEKNFSKVDVVSVKIEFFGDLSGEHMLNYKYDSTRVIDIEKDFESIHLSGGASFIKTETFSDPDIRFDVRLQAAEDAKLLTAIIIEKMAYGVVVAPTYYYRVHSSSAMRTSSNNRSWYLDTPKYAHEAMIRYAQNKLGYTPRYVQYVICYDLQRRLFQRDQAVLNDAELRKYKKSLEKLLLSIDDDIILKQKLIGYQEKLFALSKKYDKELLKKAIRKGNKYYYDNTLLYNYSKNGQAIVLDKLEIEDNEVVIEGSMSGLAFDGVGIGFLVNGKFYQASRVNRPYKSSRFFDEIVSDKNCFSVQLPIKYGDSLTGALKLAGGKYKRVQIKGGKLSRLPLFKNGRSYLSAGKYLICHIKPRTLVFLKRSMPRHAYKEFRYELVLSGKAALTRATYFISKFFVKSKIWLVSDRADSARDNGEAFFRYAKAQASPGVRIYFAIRKSSPDYRRMKVYGRVVNRDGYLYKLLFLLAEKVISSHTDNYVLNAFGKEKDKFIDLLNFKLIFLQHGIIHNDVSRGLNKGTKDISLFVSSAKPEQKALTSENYGYTDKEVQLLGLARYDLLKNEPRNKLIIAPTWRWNLVDKADLSNGSHAYSEKFITSNYYRFYQKLINDSRIVDSLHQFGMQGEFYIHPELGQQAKDFTSNEVFKVKQPPYDYTTAVSQGSLFVTDYSSVAFDFAYLQKPVIYCQFDKSEFFSTHIYKPGYFSYDKDGFGPVTVDYEATVRAIVSSIKANCIQPNKYKQRVDEFFYWRDRHNCRRTYEAIISMDKRVCL